MAAIIENNINFDGSFSKNAIKFFKELFNQPTWLMWLVLIVILVGLGYFGYRYYSDTTDITELREQVELLNKDISNTLTNDEFKENINYLITGIKLLEQQESQSFNDELLEIDLLINLVESYHPNEQMVHDFQAMKQRLITNHEIHVQNYNFYMNHLNRLLNDSTNTR